MGTKEQKTAVWLLLFLGVQIIALIITYVNLFIGITPKGPHNYDKYPFNLETVITKYNEDKDEEAAITIEGEKKKQILKMLSNASEHWRYDEKKFNYDYKIDTGNIIVYYLDVHEKILENHGFYELTEEECGVIEALFGGNSEKEVDAYGE
ncbi:MAG: hypothetical protein K2M78_17875 [Lachnospiraceae bacterium]|nr:hypothetical protein [Lachnospiraceae bacterium]